jgi:hypothetical protein
MSSQVRFAEAEARAAPPRAEGSRPRGADARPATAAAEQPQPAPIEQVVAREMPSLNILPVAHQSFQDLFLDMAKDPWKGNYARIMRRFDPSNDDPVNGDELWNQVVKLRPDHPQAYLTCAHTASGTRIFCLHTPTWYMPLLDGATTLWDKLGFTFLGDVFQGNVTTVYFPDKAFNIMDPIDARLANRLTLDLPGLQGATVLAPLGENDTATSQVLTRRFMYLLFQYVSR